MFHPYSCLLGHHPSCVLEPTYTSGDLVENTISNDFHFLILVSSCYSWCLSTNVRRLLLLLLFKNFQVHTQFVESMLGVHKKYKALIQEVFSNDQSFMGALDKACSSVINYRPNPKQPCRSPELVSIT